MAGVIAETAMLSPAIWIRSPMLMVPSTGDVLGGGILGIDIAQVRARLSVHPDHIATQSLDLCLVAEAAAVRAMMPV